jgi:dihydrodipicolinate synthase/N-acetylneuraminate lyase
LLPISNVAGTKYTGPNMFELQQIAELRRDNWYVFSGMDEQCVFARLSGVIGNIGSTLNFMPCAYRQMHACLTRGELAAAMTWQQRANVLTGIMIKHGFQAALAEVMGVLGFPCGRVRLPHPPLPESQRAGLIAALKAAGFDELTRL